MLYYGLSHQDELRHHVRRVCDVLGGGKYNAAMPFMLRIAAPESGMGTTKDKYPFEHGVGPFQLDEIRVIDTKLNTRKSVKEKVLAELGVNIDKVEHPYLAYSPFLSTVFCRVALMRIPEEIPAEIELQAEYWKKHWNSDAGKGDTMHFLRECGAYGVL